MQILHNKYHFIMLQKDATNTKYKLDFIIPPI